MEDQENDPVYPDKENIASVIIISVNLNFSIKKHFLTNKVDSSFDNNFIGEIIVTELIQLSGHHLVFHSYN